MAWVGGAPAWPQACCALADRPRHALPAGRRGKRIPCEPSAHPSSQPPHLNETDGSIQVVVSALCNTYASYITTPEEYGVRRGGVQGLGLSV
jgi:hypothetical protein